MPQFDPRRLDRRAALTSGANSACALVAAALAAPSRPALAISATTMSGKSKAELGIFLIDEVKQTGSTVSADLVLEGGVAATVSFDSKVWPLAEGTYNDVEVKSRDGDAAFVQVQAAGKGGGLAKLKPAFFTDAVLGIDGRYGAYGQPTDVKVISDTGRRWRVAHPGALVRRAEPEHGGRAAPRGRARHPGERLLRRPHARRQHLDDALEKVGRLGGGAQDRRSFRVASTRSTNSSRCPAPTIGTAALRGRPI